MYKKVSCTCEIAVLLIKPIVFLTFSLSSASLDLKVPIGRTLVGTAKRWTLNRSLISHSFLQLFQDFKYWPLNRWWPLNGVIY